jgi:SAM-dependent methyltransferase
MREVMLPVLLAVSAVCPGLAQPLPLPVATRGTNTSPQRTTIAYVPTRHDTVRDLLWMAEVGTNDVVYDLGAGDGRVVIAAVRDFHARRAVGIELDAKLVQESRSNAMSLGVADRVEFLHGDLFTNDFSAASVLVLYLGHGANLDLRAKIFRTLRPGARVVAHQFGMGEWTKDKTFDVRTPHLGMYGERFNEFRTNPDVPDFDDRSDRRNHDALLVWIVPAPVAGVWRGQVSAAAGESELKLTLHQRLSSVTGSFRLQGPTNLAGSITADLWGDNLRCWCVATNVPWYPNQVWIDGHVQGDSLIGGLRRWEGTNAIETQWTARRDPADFLGTWEWPGASNAPVQLRIERRNGHLVATYADKNREKSAWRDDTQPVPVFDTYDFGGGFYFTLLLGMEGLSYRGGSRRIGAQDGWLVGEAVMEDGMLKGTLAFYPYARSWMTDIADPKQPKPKELNPPHPSGRLDWQPKRVAP